jgi:hypothetical protein
MPKKKAKKDSERAELAGVMKEIAKPYMTKSVRKKYPNLALPVVLTKGRKRSQTRSR